RGWYWKSLGRLTVAAPHFDLDSLVVRRGRPRRAALTSRLTPMDYSIDTFQASDWESARGIYQEGIATGNATFEAEAPDWETWDQNHLPFARLVARRENSVVGWAALSPVSRRRVYAGVAEVSVYVAASTRGEGVGRMLLGALIEEAERNGIWTLQ